MNIRSVLFVIICIAAAWGVSLILTQQRVLLEGENKLQNIQQNITPFIWDFKVIEQDVVESFLPYWDTNTVDKTLTASSNKPQLSLNFSADVINTYRHHRLLLKTQTEFSGKLVLQFKTDLASAEYYYSPSLTLQGKIHDIDLAELSWKQLTGKQLSRGQQWGAKAHKVSSLVLIFSDLQNQLKIQSIALPMENKDLSVNHFTLDCSGKIEGQLSPLLQNVNVFNVSETCPLPSTYMWLKRQMQLQFPGSILTVKTWLPWNKLSSGPHKVNQNYTTIGIFNVVLYGFVVLMMLLAVIINRSCSLVKIFKNIKHYKTSQAYGLILFPSFVILIALLAWHPISLVAYKNLHFYFIWAVIQQLFLGYVLAEKVFYARSKDKITASLMAALVFSLLHLPSVSLFLLTFSAGFFWAMAWLTFKRVIPLAISHAVLALSFYAIASDKILYSAKVLHWFWE